MEFQNRLLPDDLLGEATTIAAIATAAGGGVGIVRISGPHAVEIGQRVCSPWPGSWHSHHLYYGSALEEGTPIDQVLFCVMKGPHSYTGEDVVEIHGHGGVLSLQRLLRSVLQAGAVLAEPGEFTKRAFLAGKMDLTQAEAVASLVGAQSVQAGRHAQRQLFGELGHLLQEVRQRLLHWLGLLEGGLDFPDLEEDRRLERDIRQDCEVVLAQLRALGTSFSRSGKTLQSGLHIALIGRTNAGKSSLINALCGEERVLVDAEPGTTRDVVEVRTTWQGVPCTLMDMAGEREGATSLEKQGLQLGKRRGRQADLLLLVVDGTVGLGPVEERLLEEFQSQVPCQVVWNKMDQPRCLPAPPGAVHCSALCGWGIQEMKEHVLQRLAPGLEESTVVLQERQAQGLLQAAAHLEQVIVGLQKGFPWDTLAAELRAASRAVGELTGEEVTEEVITRIFSQFCIGK